MARAKKDTERVQTTFTKEQMRLIRSFKGIFGDDDAEIVRSIVTHWLLDRTKKNTRAREKQ